MQSDEQLWRDYADLLDDSSSSSHVATVYELDALTAPFRRTQPPAELLASIEHLARERAATAHHGGIGRQFWWLRRPSVTPASYPTPPSRDHDGGNDHGGRPISSPPRWRRDLLGILATATVLIIIGLGLAAVLRGQRPTPPLLGAGGTSLDLDGFGANAGAKLAYERGLGTRPNLTQQRDGVTVSVQWTYVDVNQLLAYVTIQGRNADIGEFAGGLPEEAQYDRCPITLSLDSGAGTLNQPFDSSGINDSAGNDIENEGNAVSDDMRTVHCLAAANMNLSHPSEQLRFHIAVTTSGLATPSTGRILTFNVSVPVIPGRVAEPQQTTTVDGRPVTLDRVVVTPLRTRIYLSDAGQKWGGDGNPPVPWIIINGWNSPDNPGGNGSAVISGAETVFSFDYPDPGMLGLWTVQIEDFSNKNWYYGTGQPTPDPSQIATFRVDLPTVSWMRQLTPPPVPATPSATPVARAVKDPAVFDDYPEAQRVFDAGLGGSMTTQQSVGQATVRLRWTYADMNEVFALYTIQNRVLDSSAASQTSPEADPSSTCPGQLQVSSSGVTSLSQSGRESIDAPGGRTVDCLIGITTMMEQHDASIRLSLSGNLGYRDQPDPKANFNIDFNVPLQSALVSTPDQVRTIGGKRVELDRLVITPTHIEFVLSGPGQTGAQPGPMPQITVNGWNPSPTHGSDAGMDVSTDETIYWFNCPPSAYPASDTWTITVFANDQHGKPITDPAEAAIFTVKLPSGQLEVAGCSACDVKFRGAAAVRAAASTSPVIQQHGRS